MALHSLILGGDSHLQTCYALGVEVVIFRLVEGKQSARVSEQEMNPSLSDLLDGM